MCHFASDLVQEGHKVPTFAEEVETQRDADWLFCTIQRQVEGGQANHYWARSSVLEQLSLPHSLFLDLLFVIPFLTF